MDSDGNANVNLTWKEVDAIIESLSCLVKMKSSDHHVGATDLLKFFVGIKKQNIEKVIITEESVRCGPHHCESCD
tara:strand:- start:627 stop:851 length:225 start_codon:yes stop_codon:yes gene_type:complete